MNIGIDRSARALTALAVRAPARKVLRQIASDTVDLKLFTPAAQAALSLPPAQIASLELLGRSEDKDLKTYRYALTDLTATEVFTLRLAPDGTVAGLDLQRE